ncbi:MAG: hypothetical protein IJ373_03025 [Clostridia bacterium]|nr:hypothetical protein [Clostridia bacterium]MBQ8446540.1 hypothetical protein [Clostridia bacterium]
MKSFKEYSKQAADVANVQNVKSENTQNQEGATAEQLTKKIAAAYNGKSNAAMLQSILEEAERGKRAGTLSNEEIESFYQSFAPMLDGFQRKRLRAVVQRLKEI